MKLLNVMLLGLGGGMLLTPPTLPAQVTEANANPAHEKIKSEAETYYKQGNYQKTIELTSQVIQLNAKDDVAHYLRGSARVEDGIRRRDTKSVRDGIADARMAIDLNGKEHTDYYLPYLYGMASLSQLEGRKDHAEVAVQVAGSVLAQVKLTEDQKANVLYQRGRTQSFLGNYDEAAKDYQQALTFNSTHMGAFLGAAHAYASAGDVPKAEAQFNKAIQSFPNNPVVYNDRGMFFQQQKKYDQALADFTRVVELDKNAHFALTNRGFTLLEQGDPQAAEGDFDRSLKIRPEQPMVYSFRGTARLTQGKLAEATADYRKVVELDPNNPVAKADLGFALFFSEDYAGAGQQFNAATTLNKNLKHLHPWHYVAMLRSGQQAAAQQHFAKVLETTEPMKWDWADQLLGYLLGQLDERQLMAATQGENQQVNQAQQCEAHFFVGQKNAIAGNAEVAAEQFRKSLETKVSHLSAYRGSQMALQRLNVATRPGR